MFLHIAQKHFLIVVTLFCCHFNNNVLLPCSAARVQCRACKYYAVCGQNFGSAVLARYSKNVLATFVAYSGTGYRFVGRLGCILSVLVKVLLNPQLVLESRLQIGYCLVFH